MAGYRTRRRRYGVASATVAFLAGWAITALITATASFNAPRWQSTLWVYLGAHFIRLVEPTYMGFSSQSINPVAIADVPLAIHLLPVGIVTIAAAYTTSKIWSTRIRHTVANALHAGLAYLLVAVVAIVLSDMRPNITLLLLAAAVIGGGVWLGSAIVQGLTGGLPFIGIASLGTLALVGILVIGGGVAIVSALAGLIGISVGGAVLAGLAVGASRQLDRRGGRRRGRFSRTKGLKLWLEDNWKALLIAGIVIGTLAVGLTGDPIVQ